jgi:hypothetical protein
MSLYDYERSKHLAAADEPFYALIMAAMRKAGGENLDKLQAAWPGVWEELKARYKVPGGILPGDGELFAPIEVDEERGEVTQGNARVAVIQRLNALDRLAQVLDEQKTGGEDA